MRKVFLTGATGTMGSETLRQLLEHPEEIEIVLLARDSKRNHAKLDTLVDQKLVTVIWGDLRNYEDVARGVADADYVLHVGGMVSPNADHYPELTHAVNVGGAENIARAVLARPDGGRGCKVVYIGSVAQLGHRDQPMHWARSGDPVWCSRFDSYGQSKIDAERVIADSGLPCWVSLRQTGILAPDIVAKASDPITFHVPLRGVLEWVTARDSGRLMCNLVLADLPESFWKHFYNIGGGAGFRLSNYEFECRIMKAMGCPAPEKSFNTNWFATRNFHGCWYEDSDVLEDLLHFRSYPDADAFFKEYLRQLPWYFKLAPLAPAFMIKAVMGRLARKAPLGTLSWVRNRDGERLLAYFGGISGWRAIPDWKDMDVSHPDDTPVRLDHGYDESISEEQIDLEQCRKAAKFRGGRCLSDRMTPGDLDTQLEWQCHDGHRFKASPRLVLLGGHWCRECLGIDRDTRRLEDVARHNPFFAQIYR
ncbi:MAG: NAD-dependent epimerase/dehydratase family protein [Bacteroidales bacterium]|nr:NAD-dependent epimerase/dehydratase family protein [Bacteroidales bacterium]